jgi:hypothetical protein
MNNHAALVVHELDFTRHLCVSYKCSCHRDAPISCNVRGVITNGGYLKRACGARFLKAETARHTN